MYNGCMNGNNEEGMIAVILAIFDKGDYGADDDGYFDHNGNYRFHHYPSPLKRRREQKKALALPS